MVKMTPPKRKNYRVTLDVWVLATSERSAREEVNDLLHEGWGSWVDHQMSVDPEFIHPEQVEHVMMDHMIGEVRLHDDPTPRS